MIKPKEKEFIPILTEADTKETGLKINNMGSESSSGQMAQAMKATTRKAESMDKESSSGLTTQGLKANF